MLVPVILVVLWLLALVSQWPDWVSNFLLAAIVVSVFIAILTRKPKPESKFWHVRTTYQVGPFDKDPRVANYGPYCREHADQMFSSLLHDDDRSITIITPKMVPVPPEEEAGLECKACARGTYHSSC